MRLPLNKEKLSKIKPTTLRQIPGIVRRVFVYAYGSSAVLFVGLLLSTVATVAMPFIDQYLKARIFDSLISLIGEGNSMTASLLFLVAVMIAVSILASLANTLATYFDNNLYYKMDLRIDADYTQKLSSFDLSLYDDPKFNDLWSRVSVRGRHSVLSLFRQLTNLLDTFLSLVISGAILITFSPLMILVAFLVSLPFGLSSAFFSRERYKFFTSNAQMERDFLHTRGYLQRDTRLMEIKIFNITDHLLNRFVGMKEEFQNGVVSIMNRGYKYDTLFSATSALGTGLVVILLINAVFTGELSVGSLVFYLGAFERMNTSIRRVMRDLARAYDDAYYTMEMFNLLDLEPTVKSGNVLLPMGKTPPRIEFVNVNFKYPGTKTLVLRDFNLNVKPGESVAFVGENGAGKSTLIKLLLRFYDITSGEILVDGTNIKELDLSSWYSKVAALFQDYNFYHYDAKTNIGFGKVSEMDNEKEIKEAAKKAGAHEFIMRYPNKYDQVLSKDFTNGITPSVGQKQRISISRAFFKDSPILILDEPTSAIDAKAEAEIFERLFEFANEKTVLIVSHRFSTVRHASRIVVIQDGRIVEEGRHEELVKLKDGVYKTAFELQRRGYE